MDTAPFPLERRMDLLSRADIASQLPVAFANGMVWREVTGDCNRCGQEIPAACFRGVVARPLASVATVEAVGVCGCGAITCFHYRLHDDRRITGPDRAGRWRTWTQDQQRKPLWLSVLAWVLGGNI